MALRREIVDLVGLVLLHEANEIRRVRQIAVVHEEARLPLVRIDVEIIDPRGVERGGAAFDAVDDIAFFKKQARQISAVLACDACDERRFSVF